MNEASGFIVFFLEAAYFQKSHWNIPNFTLVRSLW